jgi:hypothetical protein
MINIKSDNQYNWLYEEYQFIGSIGAYRKWTTGEEDRFYELRAALAAYTPEWLK